MSEQPQSHQSNPNFQQKVETIQTNPPKFPNKKHDNSTLVTLLVFGLILIIGCTTWYILQLRQPNKTTSSSTDQFTARNKNMDQTTTESKTPIKTGVVNITKVAFEPQIIVIQKGVTVTWTNNDISEHQIAGDPHPEHTSTLGLISPKLAKDDSFSFIFDEVGTYAYHDENNPTIITGQVVVE